MPLQGDQRALLKLLSERGQSYDDISGLLGVPADEVRERTRAALEEIGGSDPDAGEVPLTDFLVGQADPIGRADAVRHLQVDADSLALAERIQAGLALVAPDAKQPTLPEARGKRRRAALPEESAEPPPRPVAGPDGPDSGVTGSRTRLYAVLALLGLILVGVILVVAGVFSGSDSDSSTPTEATTPSGQTIPVSLRPTGGSGVAGTATFSIVDDQQLSVDMDVQGLDPGLKSGESYVVWMMVGDTKGYPIDRIQADDSGSFSGRLSVPSSIALAVGSQATSVRISSTSEEAIQAGIRAAVKQKVPILTFTGSELASGRIPLASPDGGDKSGGGDSGAGKGDGSGSGESGG